MDIFKWVISHPEITLIGSITILQIAPIKIDPWKAIVHWLRDTIVGDFEKRFDKLEAKVDSIEKRQIVSEEEKQKDCAENARKRILRFADECRRKVNHSEEFFNDILEDVTTYTSFCNSHPGYPNAKAQSAISLINEIYAECYKNNTFL